MIMLKLDLKLCKIQNREQDLKYYLLTGKVHTHFVTQRVSLTF